MLNKQHLPLDSRESLGNFQAIKTGKKKRRHICKNIISTEMPEFKSLVLSASLKGAVAPAGWWGLSQHLLGTAGHPTRATSALQSLCRSSSSLSWFSLLSPQWLKDGTPKAAHWREGNKGCCLLPEGQDYAHLPPALSHLLQEQPHRASVFLFQRRWMRNPRPRDSDDSGWSHTQLWWLCVGWSGLWFKKHTLKE